MPATAAQAGIGASIMVDTTGLGAYATFGEVKEISGPDTEVGKIDATHLLSPNFTKEWIPGLITGGDVVLTIQFTRSMMTLLQSYLRLIKNFKITFADALTTCTFTAMITKYGNDIKTEDAVMTPITLAVSGKPVWS